MAVKQETIVIDLDGTLANLDHRVHLVHCEKPNWDEFYKRVGDDELNKWCAELMDMMAAKYHVVIVSGRPKRCIPATKKWLEDHQVSYHKLYLLRKDGDYTPDHELKKAWLDGYGKNKILFTVDDRQRVVDMWRKEGVTCLQCNAWLELKEEREIVRLRKIKNLAESFLIARDTQIEAIAQEALNELGKAVFPK